MDKILKTILKHKVYLLILLVFVTIIVFTNQRENFSMNEIWTLFDSEESKPVEEEDECSEE